MRIGGISLMLRKGKLINNPLKTAVVSHRKRAYLIDKWMVSSSIRMSGNVLVRLIAWLLEASYVTDDQKSHCIESRSTA